MRIDEALLLTYCHLDALNLKDWRVKVTERFTAPTLADLVGYCELPDKTIWLTKRGIENDAEARELIRHEVAHAIQPAVQYRDESKAHGDDFKAALARVRSLNISV
jgi:hypothetical protein